jgi:hypothetical protein
MLAVVFIFFSGFSAAREVMKTPNKPTSYEDKY